MIPLALLLACRPPSGHPAAEAPGPEVRFRPSEATGEWAEMWVDAIPGSTWDEGLVEATSHLVSLATSRRAVIDAASSTHVLSVAGYPAQARFARLLNGGAFPADLAEQVVAETLGQGEVDVALARRSYGDGTALWIAGWSRRVADIDPLPRDLDLDETLSLRVDLPDAPSNTEMRLFIAPPDAAVEELALTNRVHRQVDRFHTPGEHRLEVVVEPGVVALLFSVFVESRPPELRGLPAPPDGGPDPSRAEAELYAALSLLRTSHGLQDLERFELFEPLAREHSALMAATGRVGHVLPGTSAGVPERAAEVAHPRARHFENVAAATTAEEALALVAGSPGHLRNLLCEECTHVSIGAAIEPVLNRRPRLFVTWELLAFPQGPPRPIDHYNR